jgi:hypothetical protein
MVKPKKERPARRRAITISLYMVAWVLLTLLAPAWLVAGLVIGAMRRRSFVTLRLLIFAWFFLGIAMVALVRLAVVFTFLREDPSGSKLVFSSCSNGGLMRSYGQPAGC